MPPAEEASKPGLPPAGKPNPEGESVNPAVLAHPAEAAATGTTESAPESGMPPAQEASKPGLPPAGKPNPESESVNPAVLAHPAEAAATETGEKGLQAQETVSPIRENGQLGKIPMSHSIYHPEVAQASPWHTWNHLVQQGLISEVQPGGGSHRGVGLPDHGHGSMVSPLTHKEPLIESVSVLGNANNVRLKNGAAAQLADTSSVTPITEDTSPTANLNTGDNSVFLGGDSIGTPVSDTIPGSVVGVGNEQPTHDIKAPVTGSGIAQSNLEGISTISKPQEEKSLEISKLSDYDILDVDLQGVNSMKREYLDRGIVLRGRKYSKYVNVQFVINCYYH